MSRNALVVLFDCRHLRISAENTTFVAREIEKLSYQIGKFFAALTQ